MDEMFMFDTPEIEAFRRMYEAAVPSPRPVKTVETMDLSVAIDDLRDLGVRIFPNPVVAGPLRVEGINDRVTGIEVYGLGGALVARHAPAGQRTWQVQLPPGAATYLVVVRTKERSFVQRVVVL